MVTIQKLVPQVYYSSRDFQVLGRSLELIANYCKTNIDLIESVPINSHIDNKLIELLSNFIGFNNRFSYSSEELSYVVQIFRKLIKNKGNVSSIESLIKCLFLAKKIDEPFTIDISNYSATSAVKRVTIILTKAVDKIEVQLLQEILEYILPIGCIFNILNAKTAKADPVTSYISDYGAAGILKDSEENFSNIKVSTTTSSAMATSNNKEAGEKFGEVINPIIGNIKATRVAKKKKGGN